MTMGKSPFLNRRWIFNWLFFYCHVSFSGDSMKFFKRNFLLKESIFKVFGCTKMPNFTLKKVSSCQKLSFKMGWGVFPTSPPDHLNTHRKLFPINHLITDYPNQGWVPFSLGKTHQWHPFFQQHWKKTNRKQKPCRKHRQSWGWCLGSTLQWSWCISLQRCLENRENEGNLRDPILWGSWGAISLGFGGGKSSFQDSNFMYSWRTGFLPKASNHWMENNLRNIDFFES